MNNNTIIVINRLAWLMLILVFFVCAGWAYFSFNGEKTYTTTFNADTFGITMLSPQERLHQGKPATIIAEPVYFKVRAPVDFKTAEIQLDFETLGDPIIDLGVIANAERGVGALQSVQNPLLEQLLTNQQYQVDNIGKHEYYLRKDVHDPWIDELEEKGNEDLLIAQYDHTIAIPYVPRSYEPQKTARTYTVGLHMPGNMYVYLAEDESLDMTLHFTSIPHGEVIIRDVSTGNEVMKQVLNDAETQVHRDGLVAGTYHIALKASSDLVLKTITTTQQKFAFKGPLILAKNQSMTWVTDSPQVTVKANTTDGLQSLSINGGDLVIKQRDVLYPFSADGNATIIVPQGDITITGSRLFSPTADTFFNPLSANFREVTNANQIKYDIIIAKYEPPHDGKKTLTIDLTHAYRDAYGYEFVISVPGIEVHGSEVRIKGLTVTLRREPHTIRDILTTVYEKVFN